MTVIETEPIQGGTVIQRPPYNPNQPSLRTRIVQRRAERSRGTTLVNPPAPVSEPLPEPPKEGVQECQETLLVDNDETLSDLLLDDEFLTPMMSSVFDLSGVDEQTMLPSD